ncbi:MAG: hypothetical protein AAF355_05745 [Myxococcota bacterium]
MSKKVFMGTLCAGLLALGCGDDDSSGMAGDGGSGVSGLNACGGTAILSDATAVPGQPCGACDTGIWTCVDEDTLECANEATVVANVAAGGTVEASSTFDPKFPKELSIDDNLGTAWFSSGPKEGGAPSTYTWTGSSSCITSIDVLSLSTHDNVNFRNGFGFGTITVDVFDGQERVAQSVEDVSQNDPQTQSDPNVSVTYEGGVQADRIVLSLADHESDLCGGFSELVINAVSN